VVGDYKSREVEIYSPEGKCQHLLKNIESHGFLRPILAYIRGKILACGANPGLNMRCWSYNTQANTWTTINQPSLVNRFQKGILMLLILPNSFFFNSSKNAMFYDIAPEWDQDPPYSSDVLVKLFFDLF